MLIHPWDEATKAEWQELLTHVDFGQVIAAGRGRDYPVVVPTHFLSRSWPRSSICSGDRSWPTRVALCPR